MGKLRDIWLVMTGRLSSGALHRANAMLQIQSEQITVLCEQLHYANNHNNVAANLNDLVGMGELSHGVMRGPGLFQARRPPDGAGNDP